MNARWVLGFLAAAVLAFGGCPKANEPFQFPDVGVPDVFVPVGKGLQDSCATTSECRPGLVCADDAVCEAAGTQELGQECFISGECEEGLYCGPQFGCVGPKTYKEDADCETDVDCTSDVDPDARCVPLVPHKCQAQGEGAVNTPCSFDRDCTAGLFCDFIGVTGLCTPGGEADLHEDCTTTHDCQPGLVCVEDQGCLGLVEALGESQWDGAECDAPDPDNPRAYFEVPGSSGKLTEFYRLPFPNDIRTKVGKITSGHPVPGRGVLSFDPIQRILDAVDQGLDGFGSSPTVFFRFSAALDFETVDFTHDETVPNVQLVNIDPESDHYKQPRGYIWSASDGRGKYLCNNWLTLRNHQHDTLDPGTTYAALLLKGLKTCAESDDPDLNCASASPGFQPDADFVAMLAEEPPSETRLKVAWEIYGALRAYLAEEGIPAGDVLAAAVFTTADYSAVMRNARAVVRKLPSPPPTELVLCGDGAESPCHDAEEQSRQCPTDANPNFHEIHGKLDLPIFQEGTAPYLTPDDGGGIKLGPGQVPQVTRTEPVCFSLTIPKTGPVPASGWPVVMYSHGTGGTFRSPVLDGTAQNLSVAQANTEGTGVAVLTIDGSMHGSRRNSDLPAEVLFFNIGNPIAARGNVYQGAIDFMAVTFFIETQAAAGPLSVLPESKLDAARIGFLGHSQGATIGPLFAAFEPLSHVNLISGAGAGLVESLLNKTNPVNVAAGVQLILREESPPAATHPVLSLMQQLFDTVDNVNYGALLTKNPPEGVKPAHNTLVIYGKGDTFTPPETTRILADVMGLNIVAPAIDTAPGDPFHGYKGDPETDKVLEPPVGADFTVNEDAVTLGMTMYAPTSDYDGHFVLFRHPDALTHSREFFASWFRTGVATIGSP